MSTGVLIAGTWLAADKASFINLTINVTSSEISPASISEDAEKILKVIDSNIRETTKKCLLRKQKEAKPQNIFSEKVNYLYLLSAGVC